MRGLRVLLLLILCLLVALPAGAQARHLNPQDPLNIAVYCQGTDITVYHIRADGQGEQALYVSRDQINGAVARAYTSGGAVTVGTGDYNVSLTALPGVRLRASQRLDGRDPYDYEFAGDTCAPINLNNITAFTPPTAANLTTDTSITVSGATTPTSSATIGTIDYTIQRGDSFYRIARQFDISVDELTAANGTVLSDVIYPGQTLKIPNQVVQPTAGTGAPAAQPQTPQITVDASGNFLQDASFDGIYSGRGSPDLNIPAAWGLQVITAPRVYEWQNLRPYAFPRRDPPIHGGNFSLNINRGYATFSVLVYQQVRVPTNASLEAGAWAWYDTCDAGRSVCDNSGNPNFRVGIDPNGGTNPYDSAVAWSPFIAPQGFWQPTSVGAKARGDVVTVYISASQELPRPINELYIDDAWLRER
jgi:LysM repeat protein